MGWRSIILGLLIGWFISGCDTTGSIDSPDDQFFVKLYGGEGNQEGVDLVENPDGTFTLFGNAQSLNDGSQLFLVNARQDGSIVWEKTFGSPLNENAKDIELTNDGRLVIVADVENAPGEHDIMVMTLTLDGNEIASNITGFNSAGIPTDEIALSVTQSVDGFLVAGSTSNLDLKPIGSGVSNDTRDALHLRYFDDLTIFPNTWRQAHGPGDFDEGVKVVQVSPGLFYFFGYTNTQSGDFNFYVLGLGATGETNQTDNFLPGIPASNEILSSVIISPAQSGEGFLLTGITSSAPGVKDLFAVKLRKTLTFTNSDFLFQKTLSINLQDINQDRAAAFASISSGFLIVSNERSTGPQNFLLTKISNEGNLVWTTPPFFTFGSELDDRIGSVIELSNERIGIVGTMAVGAEGETKMAFIKVNKEGKFLE